MKILFLSAFLASFILSISATLLTPHLVQKQFLERFGIQKEYKSKAVREAIYTQWVDHFDSEDPYTFDQTIFINDQYYAPGGPVFIFITHHSENFEYWLENSYISQIAAETNGVIYGIEPRYYGNSQPTEDLSFDNLRFLTINQTIEDIIDVAKYLHLALADYGSDKFVLFGYDTGATLATFAHQYYPGIFDGVWAVGGKVISVYDFQSYFGDIENTLNSILDSTCSPILGGAFEELDSLVQAGDDEAIERIFGIIDFNTDDVNDVSVFFYILGNFLSAHLEWGSENEVRYMCSQLVESSNGGASNLEAFGAYARPAVEGGVVDWSYFIDYLTQESWESDAAQFGERQYWTVACRQWSWFTTSNLLSSPVNSKFQENVFAQLCNDVFGISRDEIINGNDRTNNEYTIRVSVQNIYFTNGGFDPFRLISVTSDLNAWTPADVIPRIGKAFELRRFLSDDYLTPEMIAVRKHARARIYYWMGIEI
jgi:pimeloyl-ACP methyl ester carboxylesterase